MTTIWVTIAALAAGTALLRAAGPVLLGGRDLHPRLMAVITLLAPTLLAALVVTQTVGDTEGVSIDARLVGLAVAGGAIAARQLAVVVVLLAAGATAAVRALS